MNPLRQAFFVALAIAGIAIGYGLGFVMKDSPAPPPAPFPKTAPPSPVQAPEALRAYVEPLRQDLIETPVIVVETTPPETATDLAPVPVLPKTAPPLEPEPVPAAEAKTLPKPTPEPATKPEPASKTEAGPVAVATPKTVGIKPKIVIVMDDLGIDKPRTTRTIKLRAPLTLSFMSYASDLKNQTQAALAGGHELWLHIPMEPGSPDIDPGPNVLLTGIPEQELLASLTWNLSQFSGYVGVNNHMGSRFTADLTGMTVVMKELKKRGLMFLDSVTSGKSVAMRAARETGVASRRRNVFLDHQDDARGIAYRLTEVELLARKTGLAIAIGHPRENTLQALEPWLGSLEARGFQLVALSTAFKKP
ncbi:MAG: divergent polysaccharide deacetylase family protein [Proteobacteria bacterium]|nr:divergent polysaccharide deacetylase family protein [Pseudomonadota bacterium]